MREFLHHYSTHLVLAVLVGFIVWSVYETERNSMRGEPAGEFSFRALGGDGEIGLAEQRGKIVLLDFWALWCGPCVDALPELQSLYEFYDDEHFSLLSVNIDADIPAHERRARLQRLVRRFGLDFPILLGDGRAAEAYGVNSIPHIVLIDRGGVVRFVHPGGTSVRRLRNEIDELLSETDA